MIKSNDNGFSLVEVIIGVGIATFIGLIGMNTIQNMKKSEQIFDKKLEQSSLMSGINQYISSPTKCSSLFTHSNIIINGQDETEFTELNVFIPKGDSGDVLTLLKQGQQYGNFVVKKMSAREVSNGVVQLTFKMVDKKFEAQSDSHMITELILLHVNRDDIGQITSCKNSTSIHPSELVDKFCQGSGGTFKMTDGSCFHVGIDSGTDCVDQNKVASGFSYDVDSGVYYQNCRDLSLGDLQQEVDPSTGEVRSSLLATTAFMGAGFSHCDPSNLHFSYAFLSDNSYPSSVRIDCLVENITENVFDPPDPSLICGSHNCSGTGTTVGSSCGSHDDCLVSSSNECTCCSGHMVLTLYAENGNHGCCEGMVYAICNNYPYCVDPNNVPAFCIVK